MSPQGVMSCEKANYSLGSPSQLLSVFLIFIITFVYRTCHKEPCDLKYLMKSISYRTQDVRGNYKENCLLGHDVMQSDESTDFSEVNFYQPTQQHIPDDSTLCNIY